MCVCERQRRGEEGRRRGRRGGGKEEREEWKSVKQEAYRFQVAVDNSFSVQQLEALEESVGKPSDECDTEPLKVVLLNQLIQIHPEEGGEDVRGEGGEGEGRRG